EVAEQNGELPTLALCRRPAERGAARTAELLFRVVASAARGARLAEVAAAGRAVAAVRAVPMTARRTADFRLRVHNLVAPAGARCARLCFTDGRSVNGGRRLVDDRTRYPSRARKTNVQPSMALEIPTADRNEPWSGSLRQVEHRLPYITVEAADLPEDLVALVTLTSSTSADLRRRLG